MSELHKRLIAAVNKRFSGSASTPATGRARSEITSVCPTGIAAVDHYVIGAGGFPCGRMAELFADEGGGKTSLVYAAIGQTQALGGTAVLIESEEAFSASRAAVFGVDVERLVLIQAEEDATSITIEGVMERLEEIAGALPPPGPKRGPVLVAWDSLAATPTNAEVESGLVGKEMAMERAKLLSRACRVLAGLAARHQFALVIVNQTRTKIGGGFGGPDYTTPGGKAVKFYASLRLQILGGKAEKVGDKHVAKIVTIMAVKNKMAPPWRKARVKLNYAAGWDDVWTTVWLAKDEGLLKSGARYTREVADGVRDALLAHLRGEAD